MAGSGSTFTLEGDRGVKCLIAVAMGKLNVQIDGEPIFMLGAHGLFKVAPGVRCVIANETSLSATVHVTSIILDML